MDRDSTVSQRDSKGRRMRQARRNAGLTQKAMAIELAKYGVETDQATISRWENSGSNPQSQFDVLRAWVLITECDPAYLLGDDVQWDVDALRFDVARLPQGLKIIHHNTELQEALGITRDDIAFLAAVDWDGFFGIQRETMTMEQYIALWKRLDDLRKKWQASQQGGSV